MSKRFRHIVVPCLLILAFTGCEQIQRQLQGPSAYSIHQVTPDTVRADKSTELTITGTGFDEVDLVRFGFRKHDDDIVIIDTAGITILDGSTIEVMTPVLPGLDEKDKVWVSVAGLDSVSEELDISNHVSVIFRPPTIIDLYGMYALAVIGGVAVVTIVLAIIRRGFRRMSLRNAVLEAKGRRLMLRDERRAKAVLAEIAAEKEAAQLKLEAEFLPYADKASGKGADE